MRRGERLLDLLARGLAALAAVSIAAMALIVGAAVAMRYAAGAPLRFTEELAGLLLGATAFLALPHAVLAERSIRVTVATERLPPLWRRAAWVVGQAVFVAFAAIFALEAWSIARFTMMLDLRTDLARLPLTPFMVGATGLMVLAGILAAWRALAPARREP